jgi:uridine phosphorylase
MLLPCLPQNVSLSDLCEYEHFWEALAFDRAAPGQAASWDHHTVVMDAAPLFEFDPSPGLIEPRPPVLSEPLPHRVVLAFFPELLADLSSTHGGRRIGGFSAETGGGDIMVIGHGADAVTLVHPGMGAPLAAHHLEQLIAAGGTTFIACGGAGAVAPDLVLGQVIVPTAALRDEGTSHHYAPPTRTIPVDRQCVAAAVNALVDANVPHTTGLTWTTDASFRETPARIARRRAEGCLVVEMEAAALIAVARFRHVRLGYLLYAGDDVSGSQWQHRRWTASERRRHLLNTALRAVVHPNGIRS